MRHPNQPDVGTALILAVLCILVARIPMSGQTKVVDKGEQIKEYENTCIELLRTINVAQGTYWGGDTAKGYARTLKELGPTGVQLIDSIQASGRTPEYQLRLIPERRPGGRPIEHYAIVARPTKRLSKSQRSFYTDETGVIRYTTEDRAATVADSPLDSAQK
jgi:hypothetical protein